MELKEINAIIDEGNNKIMSKIFIDLMKDHKTEADLMKTLYNEYGGEVPIKDREQKVGKNSEKANNKLVNDYRGLIVDQGLAYTFGRPIDIQIEGEPTEKEKKTLKDFQTINKLNDLDYSTAHYAAICGKCPRLPYINKDGDLKLMNLSPWEVIFIYDKTTEELQYAMVYYSIKVINVADPVKTFEARYVEWYDDVNVYYFRETQEKSNNFVPDPEMISPVQAHGFKEVPIVNFKNNDSERGDFTQVRTLIDAMDRALSDAQNEIEDYRNAYMVFKGVIPDKETLKDAKETGAFGSDDKEFDISFLTKDLNSSFLDSQKKQLNEHIYKFSKRVDMADEKFSGSAQSGESRKWKLLALENDATVKERKFSSALRDMYRVIEAVWVKRSLVKQGFYLDLSFQFTRNLPVDLLYYGDVLTKFWGKVSKETIYTLLPFIDDVQEEIDKLAEENESSLDQYDDEGNLIPKQEDSNAPEE